MGTFKHPTTIIRLIHARYRTPHQTTNMSPKLFACVFAIVLLAAMPHGGNAQGGFDISALFQPWCTGFGFVVENVWCLIEQAPLCSIARQLLSGPPCNAKAPAPAAAS